MLCFINCPNLARIDDVEKDVALFGEESIPDGRQIARVVCVAAVGLDNGERNGDTGRKDEPAAVLELDKAARLELGHHLAHELLIVGLAALDDLDVEYSIDVLEVLARLVAYQLPALDDLRVVVLQLDDALVGARLERLVLVEALLGLFLFLYKITNIIVSIFVISMF